MSPMTRHEPATWDQKPTASCIHGDLVTRVQYSANSDPDRPGVLQRGLGLLIADEPAVAGQRTAEEEELRALRVEVALAKQKQTEENKRLRLKRAANKKKGAMPEVDEWVARLIKISALVNELIPLYRQALADPLDNRLESTKRQQYMFALRLQQMSFVALRVSVAGTGSSEEEDTRKGGHAEREDTAIE